MLRNLLQKLPLKTNFSYNFQTELNSGNLYGTIRSSVSSCLLTRHFYDTNKNYNYCGAKSKIFHKNERLLYNNAANYAAIKVQVFDLNDVMKEFLKINMSDLKQVPLPAFWVGFAGLLPFIFPPLSSIIIGYSPLLTSLQLSYGIAVLAFTGGIKWGGLTNASKDMISWENYFFCAVPPLISTVAIVVPQAASFLLVIIGLITSFVIDLTSSSYPRWLIALRGVLTNISVFFLLISLIQNLLH